ncbi:MAG: 50S ribosomal protein L11 methyltransferase [Bacillota bacterium]|jgi:ribosomal protein L11 methyltransferase
MKWVEVAVEINREAIDAVANLLQDAGANGTVIEDDHETSSGEFYEIPLPAPAEMKATAFVKAYLPQNDLVGEKVNFIKSQLEVFRQFLTVGPGSITLRTVEDAEWASAWKQHFKSQQVGKKLMVVPSWEQADESTDNINIYLDPGMAFGTGAHPTTRRCLQVLEDHIHGNEVIYDVGTGSGILAIAAAKLGAAKIIGIDLDPVAIGIARENVAFNKVSDKVTIREGDLLSVGGEPAGGVIANIIADAIIMLAPDVPGHLVPGGFFLAAGIIEGRRDETLRAIAEAGLKIREIHQDGEWITVFATKS